MSQSTGILDITFKASQNLEASQYRFVMLSGSTTPMGVQLVTAAAYFAAQTNVHIGILQNDPKEGESAVVRIAGTSKLVASTPLAINAKLCGGTLAGKAMEALTAADYVGAIAIETAAAAGDIIEVLIVGYTRV